MIKMSVKPQYKDDGSCDVFDVNSKYLHKKFKKMAETAPVREKGIAQDDTTTIKGLVNCVNRDANSSVNGQSRIITTPNDLDALQVGVHVYDKNIGASEEVHLTDGNKFAPRDQNVCTQCKFECAKYGVQQKCIHEHPYPFSSSKPLGRDDSYLTRPCGSRDHPLVNKSGGNSGNVSTNPSDTECDTTNHYDARPLTAYSSKRDASGESLPPPVSRETNNNQDYSKHIYKPKFKAALHYEEGEMGATCETTSSIFQPSNCVIVTSSVSIFGSQKKCEPIISTRHKSPSSPGSEHSPRHINNPDNGELNADECDSGITDNLYRALRRDMPVDQQSSFISVSSHFLKPHLPLGSSMLLPAPSDPAHQLQSAAQRSSQSKLAVAFRPLDVETVSLHSVQPLNLSAPNNISEKNMAACSGVDAYYRKRIHPEEFSSAVNYEGNKSVFHSNVFAGLTSSEKVEKAQLFNGGSSGKLLHSLQNPEGLTIKDLLLKAGEKAQAVGVMQSNLKDVLSIGEVIAESDALITDLPINSPNESSYYNCTFCKVVFQSAAALIIHQQLHCRHKQLPHSGSVRSPHHSPDLDLEKHVNSHRNKSSALSKELQPLVMPIGNTSVSSPSASLSSPGPVLGNTLLIAKSTRQKHKDGRGSLEEPEDKFHTAVTLSKRQRLDLDLQSSQTTRSMGPTLTVTDISGSVTSLRKVDDLPKFTAHQNSRRVFGEVQILDGEGKSMSFLGNTSAKPLGSIPDVIVKLPSHLRQSGFPIHASTPNEIIGDVQQHIIGSSESQSDSGVIHVARESSSSSPANHPSGNVFMSLHVPGSNHPTNNGHQRSKSSSPVRKPSQITVGGVVSSTPPPPFSYPTMSLLSPNTASTTNLPAHITKHLVPVPPNISVPNLTAANIPVRTLGQHLPFMPFLLGLSDFTLVNSLNHVTPSNPQLPQETLSCSKTSSLATSQDSGGALTILHKGKHIPYVPGMPGPQSLLLSSPIQTSSREETVSEPLDLVSPSKEDYHQYFVSKRRRIDDISSLKSRSNKEDPAMYETERYAENCVTSENKKYIVERKSSVLHSSDQSQVKSLVTGEPRILSDSKRVTISLPSPVQSTLVMQTSDNGKPVLYDPVAHNNSKSSKPSKYQPIIQSSDDDSKQENTNKQDILREENNHCESKIESNCTDNIGTTAVKFHRPNSLPLKPETFVPKKHFQFGSTPGGSVVLQVSPETPRSRKSFGQLYLQGNVFTFLNLKISTRPFFCILTRTQPMYVMQTPENPKLSMYSNWRIKKTACPNPLGLSTGEALSLYDSRNRCQAYTTAKSKDKEKMIYTHSSYWFSREHLQTYKTRASRPDWEKSSNGSKHKEEAPKTTESEASSGEPPPRKTKIFGRGFESKDDYTYVKGRGRGRYVCNDCGIRCLKPSMLRNHIRTHTNIRPYICRHCNFSFKTKGNLTKHMKSKAHYKKCIKLCIFPVPTVVDDSYIDEECFAQQQVAQQGESGDTDSEDNEEEDEEEDDDKESEEVSNDYLEHEAAHSLLSLSEPVLPCSSPPSSGLAPASSYTGRPSTYPYMLSVRKVGTNNGTSCSILQSPGLTPVCAQMERETVLRNTSLALELGSRRGDRRQDNCREMSTMVYRRDDAAPVTLIPRQQNDVGKYHSASERTTTSYNSKCSTDGRSTTDKGSDADDEYGSSISCSEDDSETSGRKEKSYSDVDSCSTALILQPIDLSTKSTTCVSLHPRKAQLATVTATSPFPSRLQLGSFMEIYAPFPGPTTVISSPNSLVERSPLSGQMLVDLQVHTSTDAAETNILHKYLTKHEVQNAKLHQQNESVLTETPASPVAHAVPRPSVNIALTTADAIYEHSQKNEVDPPRHQFPPNTKLLSEFSEEGGVNLGKVQLSQESPRVNADTSTSRCGEHPDRAASRDSDKHRAMSTDRAAVSMNDAAPEVPSANCDSLTKNRVISRLGFSGESWVPSLPVTSNAADPEVKAEFLPPSTRPLPAYVRVMEDGQSMCIICNKVFSKPSQLRLHINIHCLEHPFKCELCAVSFRKKGHLKKHESSVSHQNRVGTTAAVCTLTTTNPRPFKCDDCNIAFRIHGHLAKHLRSKMHIMKLECIGKLPFGTYEEMEREGFDPYDIDTTDCENSLESLQVLAQRLHEKDPTKLGHWGGGEGDSFHPNCPSPVALAQRSRDSCSSVQVAEANMAPASDGSGQHDPVEAGCTVQEFTVASSPPCREQHM